MQGGDTTIVIPTSGDQASFGGHHQPRLSSYSIAAIVLFTTVVTMFNRTPSKLQIRQVIADDRA